MANETQRKRIEEIIREEIANLEESFREELLKNLSERNKVEEKSLKRGIKDG